VGGSPEFNSQSQYVILAPEILTIGFFCPPFATLINAKPSYAAIGTAQATAHDTTRLSIYLRRQGRSTRRSRARDTSRKFYKPPRNRFSRTALSLLESTHQSLHRGRRLVRGAIFWLNPSTSPALKRAAQANEISANGESTSASSMVLWREGQRITAGHGCGNRYGHG